VAKDLKRWRDCRGERRL